MNFERVEELCLRYLGGSVNPAIPVEKIYDYCRREEPEDALTMPVLLSFLRNHEQIVVLEGPDANESVSPGEFAGAGFLMGPRAMLKVRIPSGRYVHAMLMEQLNVMREKLEAVRAEIVQSGDLERLRQTDAAIRRAEEMAEKLDRLKE